MLNWIKFWIIKVVKMINKNLLVLDLSDGVQKLANISSFEEVTSVADADLMLIEQGTAQAIRKVSIEDLKAEFGGDLPTGTENQTLTYNSSNQLVATSILQTSISNNQIYANQLLNADKGINIAYSTGNMLILRTPSNQINFKAHANTTNNATINIKNTKSSFVKGDILIFDNTDSTFKFDNISNYAGTGNYHVLVVDFLENEDYETTTIVPEGAIIDRIVIQSNGLTNGIEPLIFSIGGTSNIVLATQGFEFDNSAGIYNTQISTSVILEVGTGEAGTFQSNWSGAGFGTGNGKAYLFYWTPLS
jgi:hypothetical protein